MHFFQPLRSRLHQRLDGSSSLRNPPVPVSVPHCWKPFGVLSQGLEWVQRLSSRLLLLGVFPAVATARRKPIDVDG